MMLHTSIGGNDSPTNTVKPPGPSVGWEFANDDNNAHGAVPIGPRIFATAAHVGVLPTIQYRGVTYSKDPAVVTNLIFDPAHGYAGDDSQFIVVTADVPEFCYPWIGAPFDGGGDWFNTEEIYIVAAGEGYGTVDGAGYHWGGPTTQRKRWARLGNVICPVAWSPHPDFTWEFMSPGGCAAAGQDSGSGVFLRKDGRLWYLGHVTSGSNPAYPGGAPSKFYANAWKHKLDIAPWLVAPPTDPPPVIIDPTPPPSQVQKPSGIVVMPSLYCGAYI